MPRVSEAILNFLQARKTTNGDLVDRWSIAMETQINVAADNGEPVDGKRSTYRDSEYEWWNIRIPRNAAGNPEFHDYELRWPLDLHAEGIGMTGWDWAARRSRWVAFDYDSITGHAKGIGVSDEELEALVLGCHLSVVEPHHPAATVNLRGEVEAGLRGHHAQDAAS